jgi:hypothetical protein
MRVFILLMLLPITLSAQQSGGPPEASAEPILAVETEAETEKEQDKKPQDRDFKPSEEISEDFPVPLPSDI